MSVRPQAFTNVRLVDPASGYDGPGAVVVTEGVIADVAKGGDLGSLSKDIEVVDVALVAGAPMQFQRMPSPSAPSTKATP